VFLSDAFRIGIWLAGLAKHRGSRILWNRFWQDFSQTFSEGDVLIVDRLYKGDPVIDVPPPPEKELRYRLLCTWKRSENFSVGGVLYVGPLGLFFVPHKLNLPGDRSAFEMGPNKNLRLSLTTPELTGLSKMLVPRPTPRLQVVWPDGNAQFIIPAPNQVLGLISERVREMV
jgi:hypothetical protein